MNSYSAGQRTCRYMDPLRCTKIDMAAVCFCERVSPRVVGVCWFRSRHCIVTALFLWVAAVCLVGALVLCVDVRLLCCSVVRLLSFSLCF